MAHHHTSPGNQPQVEVGRASPLCAHCFCTASSTLRCRKVLEAGGLMTWALAWRPHCSSAANPANPVLAAAACPTPAAPCLAPPVHSPVLAACC